MNIKKAFRFSDEFNYVHKNVDAYHLDMSLGPFEDGERENLRWFGDEFTTLAHIMHHAGIFNSVSEARRNGWNKELRFCPGYNHFVVGKRRKNIYIVLPADRDWENGA